MRIVSNYYLVENKTTMCLGGVDFDYTGEFEVFIEKYNDKTYDILINKLNRKSYGGNIDYHIKELYEQSTDDTLLPLSVLIKEEDLQIRDGRNRSLKAIDQNRNIVDCHGIDFEYIKKEFMNDMDTIEKMEEYMSFLNIIKALSISLQKQENFKIHKSDWSMRHISPVYWEDVQTYYKKTNNSLRSICDIIDKDKLIDAINKKCSNKQLPIPNTFEKEKVKLVTNYEHFVQYRTGDLDFDLSKTNVKIAIDNLIHYEETLSMYAR